MLATRMKTLISLHNDEIRHRNKEYGLVALSKCNEFVDRNCCTQIDKKDLWEYIAPSTDNTSKSDGSSLVDIELSNGNIPWSRFN